MGKAEVGTPKYIANKIKAKGLQKLKWYCQMCQKQCRDENGFKCHTMSESHQRQLLLVAENTEKFIDEFSGEFEKTYLDLLRRQYGTRRVNANVVYQEYIHDRNHVHMTATQWVTLTEFIKYLGRSGQVIADETEKGWFITYIDRDPETIALQEKLVKKEKMEKDDNDRMMEFLQQQVEKGKSASRAITEPQFTELQRGESDEQIKINLCRSLPSTSKPGSIPSANPFKIPAGKGDKLRDKGEKRKVSALEELMQEQEKERSKSKRKDYWICEGIIVKIVTKSLGEMYYKKKGRIIEVKEKYVAIIKMLDNDHILKLDQAHLETVIPAIGNFSFFSLSLLSLSLLSF
ncbi:hypothetical protein QYM36_005579 [Artemia franciscana]|uniref:DNA/RNA-binding protein Kin17 WH-like domain-containing protein n=1 Tax=Artemia franciscana TaxID=6661 RepID=A0AA88L627_ARTSF|nr:hypothetical protein QYM36_005579 [Artemia franciscana]